MAKRFRFSLEVVRKLRQQSQDVQRRRVADSIRAARRVEVRIDQLTQTLRNTVDQKRDEQRLNRPDVAELRTNQFYQSWLHRKIVESYDELAERNRELQVKRTKLGKASAQLKAIEKLREKRWQRNQQAVRREEQAATDEVAVRMFLRPRGNGADSVTVCGAEAWA